MKVLILILGFITFSARAEEDKQPAKSTSKAGVKYKKNTALEFDGRSIDGNLVSPDNADIEGDKNIKFAPLLEGRKDFKREFKRSSGVTR